MKKFKDFNIKTTVKSFIGDKIKISKVMNREIIVHDYRIEKSKIFKDRGTRKCLHLQISIGEEKHVLFTSAGALINAIQQVVTEDFPFATTIIEKDKRYEFS